MSIKHAREGHLILLYIPKQTKYVIMIFKQNWLSGNNALEIIVIKIRYVNVKRLNDFQIFKSSLKLIYLFKPSGDTVYIVLKRQPVLQKPVLQSSVVLASGHLTCETCLSNKRILFTCIAQLLIRSVCSFRLPCKN